MTGSASTDPAAAGVDGIPGAPERRVVVGVDGSASSVAALRWAGRVAAALGAEIDVVTVWEYAGTHPDVTLVAGGAQRDDAMRRVESAAAEVFGDDRPVGTRLLVLSGNSPAKTLIEASRDAEMLVLGSRGHGGFVGLLLGSVSAACAEHASCPVVVVHTGAAGSAPFVGAK
jgi:nucleotide-binding universal stress UspA family protein